MAEATCASAGSATDARRPAIRGTVLTRRNRRERGAFSRWSQIEECSMKALVWLGVAMIVAWAILWLGIKMAVGAVHALLVLGLIAIIWGVVQARRS